MSNLNEEIKSCIHCDLSSGPSGPTPGEGSVPARVLFIGEAPVGQGLVFEDQSGQLLRKMIDFLGFESYFLTTLVKCCTPGGRQPLPEEINACGGFLERQVAEIKPVVIVTVGAAVTKSVLKTDRPITDLRGNMYRLMPQNIVVVPVFHPGYCLRNPTQTAKLLIDLRQVRILEERMK